MPHMDETDPGALWPPSFLNSKGYESQPRVQQQTGRIGVETGYSHLRGTVFASGKANHCSYNVLRHPLPPCLGGHHKIADTAYAAIPPVEVGESDDLPVSFYDY